MVRPSLQFRRQIPIVVVRTAASTASLMKYAR
jgi:hypothetical protein